MQLPRVETLEQFIDSSRAYREPPPLAGVFFDGDDPPAAVPMLVKRLLPARGLTLLGGQSGAGKSFVAIDLAVSTATGEPFFGCNVTTRSSVIYVAGEGAATIAGRLAAAKKARGIVENLAVAVITVVPDLSDSAARAAFIEKLKAVADRLRAKFETPVGLVIVDTIAATFSMRDENSAAEINAVCRAVAELGDAVEAATLGLHHYGKDPSTGLRGSSAMRGAGESVLAVLADRDELSGKCSNRRLIHPKSRVGEEGPIASFELRNIDLCVDDAGEPITAAYIAAQSAEDAEASAVKRPGGELAIISKAFLEAYERLADGASDSAGFDGAIVRKVAVEALREEMKRRGFLGVNENGALSATGRSHFRRIKAEILASGKFVEDDGFVWRVRPC